MRTTKRGRGICLGALPILAAATTAAAFELKTPGYACRGHEYLATEAATTAGIDGRYLDSLSFGIRYVDLGGMRLAIDGLKVLGGDLNRIIHENEATQHHHFCLRGGVADLLFLVRDSAAWIQKLYDDARATRADARQTITDGGLIQTSRHTVYTRYFLLGAALHAIQDSFAHGARTPTYGKVKSYLAGSILEDWGGRRGSKFSGFYRTIRTAVLYPKAKLGTAKHNHVYTSTQGSPYFSDKIWNATLCDAVRSHLGNLQPHAFAAYLASVDFLDAFRKGAGLGAFFEKWFGVAGRAFPGIGSPRGKCSSGGCPYLTVPGESAYPSQGKVVAGGSKPGAASGGGSLGTLLGKLGGYLGRAVGAAGKALRSARGAAGAATGVARRAAAAAAKGATSTATATVTASALKMRQGPSTRTGVVGKLRRGRQVVVVAQRGDWFQVRDGSTVGWVYGKYLRR